MADVVIAEFLDEAAIAAHLSDVDVLYDPKLVDRPEALIAALANARGLVVRNRTQVRGALLAAATSLRVVGRLGVGLDNIDVEACAARNIAVFPATGANDVAVAEYVVATALLLTRGAYGASAGVIAGAWPRNDLIGAEVMDRTLGLLGLGGIARHVATRAAALGMRVIAHDPFLPQDSAHWACAENVSLETLLTDSDVLSLHVPLTPQTRNLIDGASIARMRRGAILINAARGGIVDEKALANALRQGHLGGAALDVFETEPLTAAAGAVFAGVPNLILTPHIAGVTTQSNTRVSDVTLHRVAQFLRENAA